MRRAKPIITLLAILFATSLPAATALASCPEVLDFEMRKLRSKQSVQLCEAYAGQPLLVVNTASHCGFTPQFKGLEALYQDYKDRGLKVAGFSSNSFEQEAKTEEEAAAMCFVNYGVTFDMYAEIPVKGNDAHPLFVELAAAKGAPGWNFNKYLISADGEVLQHWGRKVTPEDPQLRAAIEAALAD